MGRRRELVPESNPGMLARSELAAKYRTPREARHGDLRLMDGDKAPPRERLRSGPAGPMPWTLARPSRCTGGRSSGTSPVSLPDRGRWVLHGDGSVSPVRGPSSLGRSA